jgi:hypothetical protein
MGTDIHAAVEIFDGKRWRAQLWPNPWYGKYNDENCTTHDMHLSRNYNLFSILANVRNERGVDPAEGFDWIQEERGMPEDMSAEARAVLSNGHSAGWVTLSELLEFDWSKTTTTTGIVSGIEFEEWDRCREWREGPESWCKGVGGGSARIVTDTRMRAALAEIKEANHDDRGSHRRIENWTNVYPSQESLQEIKRKLGSTYTKISWKTYYAEAAGQFYTRWIPKLVQLAKDAGVRPEYLRIVFDFDS